MLVEFVYLDAFYTLVLTTAEQVGFCTSSMFCRPFGISIAVIALIIILVYSLFVIIFNCVTAIFLMVHKCRWGFLSVGILVWFTFVLHILSDNTLPLNFALCCTFYNETTETSQTMKVLRNIHIAKSSLSFVCSFIFSLIAVVFATYAFKQEQTKKKKSSNPVETAALQAGKNSSGQSSSVQGTIVQGTSVQGTSVQGTSVQGTFPQGISVQSSSISAQGISVPGISVQSTSFQGTSGQGTSVQVSCNGQQPIIL